MGVLSIQAWKICSLEFYMENNGVWILWSMPSNISSYFSGAKFCSCGMGVVGWGGYLSLMVIF